MFAFNFDVLARPHEEFGARPPDSEGLTLWRAMHQITIGRLAVVFNGAPDKEHMEHWMMVNGIKASTYMTTDTDNVEIAADRIHQFLSAGAGKHLYFDTDPEMVKRMIGFGIPSLLMCQPYVVRPEWDNPKTIRAWGELAEEIDRQKLAKATKTWGDVEL